MKKLIYTFLTLITFNATAQPNSLEPKYNDEGVPYYESFNSHFNVSSSGKLVLKSFTVFNQNKADAKRPKYEMSFMVGNSKEIVTHKIAIQDPKGQYSVIPQLNLVDGENRFSWNSDYALSKGVNSSDLLGLVYAKSDKNESIIFPVKFNEKKNDSLIIKTYKFSFAANRTVTLSYTIYSSEEKMIGNPVNKTQLENTNIDCFLDVTNFEEGYYFLHVRYDFENGASDMGEDLYKFYHKK